MGQNSGLLSNLTDWNSTLAGYADSISSGVVMPIALTVLALFMVLELYNFTQTIAMNGGSTAFTIQQVALVMLKITLCRWAVLHSTEILNAMFEVAATVTNGIAGYVGSGQVNTEVDIENAISALPGGIGNMPVAMELMVVSWMLRLVNIVINTIVAARFIELYVYNALASLPIATLCYRELHGIAVNFLKNYMAVALQGAVLYLVIGFYPALTASLGSGGDITEQAWAMLGKSVILLVAVFMSGRFTKAITSSAGQAFLILIREGLEALLVVAAVVAYLVKSGNRRFTKWIYLGVLAGLAGSGLIAVLFTFLFGGSGPIQEISEGVCALIAMLMLLWTSNWMLNKSSVEAWNRYIRTKTESAVADAQNKVAAGEGVGLGMVVSLAMLSFLAVFREGAETVIFYESIYSMSRDAQGMWIGGIAAGVVLLVIFLVLRFTSVKIPIGPFFLVTSILMAVLVVIFAGGGIHALIEGDLIDGHYLSSVPTNDWIGLYPYVECLAAQAIAAIAVLALFAVGFARKRKLRTPDNRK